MDLNYCDANGKDIGVLFGYQLDLAFGRDENNFELSLPLKKHCLKEHWRVYFENEEYGGVIDKIEVSSDEDDKEVIYKGRTWHGILEGKRIEADAGQSQVMVYGDANTVLKDLIGRMGLNNFFEASEEASGIEIVAYSFTKNTPAAYTAINSMLLENDAKLKMKYIRGKVKIWAEPNNDYSQDEDLTDDILDFSMEKDYRPVNHIICIAQGEEEYSDRYEIHLFADENGGVQPYATTDNPVKDADYILGKKNQVMHGIDEIVDIVDTASVTAVENYVLLTSQPLDWGKHYDAYYKHQFEEDGTDKFAEVEAEEREIYTVLTSQPSDWGSNYSNYYASDNGDYKAVDGIENEWYERLGKKPSDWNSNYGDYYYYYSDGITSEYKTVDGIQKEAYKVQTRQPTDWNGNYKNYYRKTTRKERKKDKKLGTYTNVTGTGKKKNGVPKWSAKKYYTKISYTVAPAWKSWHLRKVTSVNAPAWRSGTYYTQQNVIIKPTWQSGTYYKKELDHYAAIVESGLEKLEEAYHCDSISVDFHPDDNIEYDINDIIGATEHITGLSVWQPITKKIVKITEETQSIEYEVGGKS
nr:MAG TPA: hypothetical protein [Caudoviricetes sp.]